MALARLKKCDGLGVGVFSSLFYTSFKEILFTEKEQSWKGNVNLPTCT